MKTIREILEWLCGRIYDVQDDTKSINQALKEIDIYYRDKVPKKKGIYKDYYNLQKKYDSCQESINGCLSIIYCIGGPLNDNTLKYTNKQLKTFSNIAGTLKSVKD